MLTLINAKLKSEVTFRFMWVLLLRLLSPHLKEDNNCNKETILLKKSRWGKQSAFRDVMYRLSYICLEE